MSRGPSAVQGLVLPLTLCMLCACSNTTVPADAGATTLDAAAEPETVDWGRVIGQPEGVALRLMARVLREHDPLPGDGEFQFAVVDADGRVVFDNPPAPQPIDTAVDYHFSAGEHASECDGGKGPSLDNPQAKLLPVLLEAVADDGRRWNVIGANRPEYAQWRNGDEAGEITPGDAQLHVYYVDAAVRVSGRCETGSMGFTEVALDFKPGWNLEHTTVVDAGYYEEGGPYLRGTRSETVTPVPEGMGWYLLEIPDDGAGE